MGNCPSEFMVSPVGFGACVIPCPAQKNYELRIGDKGVLSCVYSGDTTISVPVLPVPAVQRQGPPFSYKDLPNASVYQTEIDRFNSAIAVTDANVNKAVKIRTAFVALQSAENARGTPAGESAYQSARIAYYTLTKGDSWLQEEQTRIANTEAQPVVNTFTSQYRDLAGKKDQQQRTIDVIKGLRDKVLSVKDDLSFSVNTFQKQVDAVKNKINIDKKARIETIETTTSWIDTFLNWTIAIATIVSIVLLVRRFASGGPSLEKLRTDTALFKAQAEYTRAKANIFPKKTV